MSTKLKVHYKLIAFLVILGVIGLAITLVWGASGSFSENFSSTTYKDATNTTGSWGDHCSTDDTGTRGCLVYTTPTTAVATAVNDGDINSINGTYNDISVDSSDNIRVAYTANAGDSRDIKLQKVNTAKVAQGDAVTVNTFTTGVQYNPAIAHFSDGGHIVLWESNEQDGTEYGIFGKLYTGTGSAVKPSGSSATSDATGQYYNGSNNTAGTGYEFRINTTTSDSQTKPRVAVDSNNRFVAVWEGPGINFAIFNQDGSAVKSETQVSTSNTNPDVVIRSDNKFAVSSTNGASTEVYVAYFDTSGAQEGNTITVFSGAGADVSAPRLAIDGSNNLGIVFTANSKVYFALYNSSTTSPTTIVSATAITTGNATYDYTGQNVPDLVADSLGNFFITYYHINEGNVSPAIFGKIYNSLGTVTRDVFIIYNSTDSNYPEVAVDSSNRFWTSLESHFLDGSNWDTQVNLQGFANTGYALSAFNTYTTIGYLQSAKLNGSDANLTSATLTATQTTPTNTSIQYYLSNSLGGGALVKNEDPNTYSYTLPSAPWAFDQTLTSPPAIDYVKVNLKNVSGTVTLFLYNNQTSVASTTSTSGTSNDFEEVTFTFDSVITDTYNSFLLSGTGKIQCETDGNYSGGSLLLVGGGLPQIISECADTVFELGNTTLATIPQWITATSGETVTFASASSDLRWKARLYGTTSTTPVITNIAISYTVPSGGTDRRRLSASQEQSENKAVETISSGNTILNNNDNTKIETLLNLPLNTEKEVSTLQTRQSLKRIKKEIKQKTAAILEEKTTPTPPHPYSWVQEDILPNLVKKGIFTKETVDQINLDELGQVINLREGIKIALWLKGKEIGENLIFLAKKEGLLDRGQTTYNLENPLTRAEFIAILMRALQDKLPDTKKTNVFSDLKNNPQANYINLAHGLKIIKGYSTSQGLLFKPDQLLTRAELLAIINNVWDMVKE
ncbi:hypothetical protein COT40_02340 [Candidatus Peregrinibacteria bacterium CG08_land_8_20_14_0_20_41_10]|nr:MAG: hypothetical protein COT40_02340 [Candidatus Peregrinibacteria bacterium CG08_land_8_20_14_0_20_41_10]